MSHIPIELEKEIFKYLDIKCHTCHVKIKSGNQYQNCIILKNFIFCSQECFNFI